MGCISEKSLLFRPVQEGDDLRTGAGAIGIEGMIFCAGGDAFGRDPGNRLCEVRAGGYIGERVSARDGGGAGVALEEGG